jgi:hypothetical protein
VAVGYTYDAEISSTSLSGLSSMVAEICTVAEPPPLTESINTELCAASSFNGKVEVAASSVVAAVRRPKPKLDPTNSVAKVRNAYRTMARVDINSGHRRIRRFNNAFFEDPMQVESDEDALQEHLHVKLEWRFVHFSLVLSVVRRKIRNVGCLLLFWKRSSFQTLLRPEHAGLRDAFVKGDYPFDMEATKKSINQKKEKDKSRSSMYTCRTTLFFLFHLHSELFFLRLLALMHSSLGIFTLLS